MSEGQRTESMFSAFNARVLDPAEVARTFVPPPALTQLVTRDNAVVVGPRGSGKTTLLKMLTREALDSWSHPSATEYIQHVDFRGIFIPTDPAWNAQLTDDFELTVDDAAVIQTASFATHVFRCIVDGIAYAATAGFNTAGMDGSIEAQLTQHLAEVLLATPRVTSLEGLSVNLGERLSLLGRLKNRLRRTTEPAPLDEHEFIDLDALTTAGALFSIADQYGLNEFPKWALLFDELELAPEATRATLLRALRVASPHIVLKLSLTPLYGVGITLDELSPAPGDDYDLVDLAFPRKTEAAQFTRDLLVAELQRRGVGHVSPERLFGPSVFDTLEDDAGHPVSYKPDRAVSKAFRGLADRDSTFWDYLARNEIDPDDLEAVRGTKRASTVRKVRNLVVLREFYFRNPDEKRSRKTARLYTGAGALLTLVDGNPRYFIGLIRPLLSALDSSDIEAGGRRRKALIPPGLQSANVTRVVNRYLALLSTLAGDDTEEDLDVLGLIATLGAYFQASVLEKPFAADAPTAFFVDAQTSVGVQKLVSKAWSLGAVVYAPETVPRPQERGLVGRKFRLTHLLAPVYRLPLRLGSARALSTIIRESASATKPSEDGRVMPLPLTWDEGNG